MKTSSHFQKLRFFLSSQARSLVCLVAFSLSVAPVTPDFFRIALLSPSLSQRDFSSGHANVPLEEIFSGLSNDSEGDVVRHALRIIEQHYVQREKLDVVKMLVSGVRAVAREHGGDIELAFLRPASAERLQLSSQRTVRLCPSTSQQSADICSDAGIVSPSLISQQGPDLHAVVRVGLRTFGVPVSAEPGLKSLDLLGRFIIPEYARLRRVSVSLAIHSYLNGILDELDPHSSYMTQEEYRELRSGTRGQFGGVGLVIDESQELPVIREVVPNSPAQMAGVRPGDVLLKVGNNISSFHPLESVLRDVRDLSVDSATPVWFYRPMSRRVYRAFLAREEIPTRSAELRTVHGRPDVVHVRVTGFSNHTAEDVYALYEHAQLLARGRLKLFVLDLRGNPGGLLDQAIQVSDLFLRSGQIVSTRSRFEEQVEQATRGVKIDLPVVVLMNSSSASASEIVAGALKDHGRALLVGERTFGKGSVQSLFELSTGTALKLTVAHYFTPQGRSLQGVGVEPHVNIKLVQPRDGYLWMSGSSEIDREEHLVSHLSNPIKNKMGLLDMFSHLSTNMWAYSRPEGNVIESLRPIHFAYPLGDNTQTMLRLDDDPVARIGINMASLLYGNRGTYHVFNEKQLKDAQKRIAGDEASQLRQAVESDERSFPWKSISKSFFDAAAVEEKGPPVSQKQNPNVTLSTSEAGAAAAETSLNHGLRDLFRLFGVFNQAPGSASSPPQGRVSLSANSVFAWQSESQLLLSVAASEVKAVSKGLAPAAFVGLRLDDLHDGPTVWLPVQFVRSNDRLFVAPVFLPKAVRTYLSSTTGGGQRPSVVGQMKWRIGDEGFSLGALQLPPLARRHGMLEGHLIARGGQNFLQIRFSRPVEVAMAPDSASQAHSVNRGLEVLMAPLTDSRLKVVSEVVSLQRISEGEYIGETELNLSSVQHHGLEFGGLVGGIVRSTSGDVLATAPLLWVGDEGVFPIRVNDELRSFPLVPW